MITYPNQKIITIFEKGEINDNDICFSAMKDLSKSTYLLWNYFYLKEEGESFPLSRKDVCETTGISEDSYKKGVKELIEKKYLCQTTTDNYLFVAEPKMLENKKSKKSSLQIDFSGVDKKIRPKNGENFLYCKISVLCRAMKDLTPEEIKLFMYLLFHRYYESYKAPMPLKPSAIGKELGLLR